MHTSKSDYEWLTDLALQFIQYIQLKNVETLPILYIETEAGERGYCHVEKTTTEFTFKIFDKDVSFLSYCQLVKRQKEKQDQRLIQKEIARQTQLVLKVTKSIYFYAHERTIHLNDEYACAMLYQLAGSEIRPLYEEHLFNYLIEGLTKWLHALPQLESYKTEKDDVIPVVLLNARTKSIERKEKVIPPPVSYEYVNDLSLYRLKKLGQNYDVWEGAQYYLTASYMMSTARFHSYPFRTHIMSQQTKQTILNEVCENESCTDYLILQFLTHVQQQGYRPIQLIVDDEIMFKQFKNVCQRLDIACSVGPLPLLTQKWKSESQRMNQPFSVSQFTEETKQHCDDVLHRTAEMLTDIEKKQFFNHLSVFRFQMYVHTAKLESRWTFIEFKSVLMLLLEHVESDSVKRIFIRDITLYVTYLRQQMFIPYADQFLMFLRQLSQEVMLQTTV